MAYSAPTTRADGYVVTASEWNKNTVDNPTALRSGEIALTSQATGDIITASSSTQLSRAAVVSLGLHKVVSGRLSLTSGTPVTTADVTAATTLYFALFGGAQIGLYDGTSRWIVSTIAELSIAVPATTNQMYDVFVDYNDGTPQLAVTAWTNDTTRATALTTQDGIYVKTGDTQQRYVGSFRTTGVSGQTEDSAAKRFVWNYYNRVRRPVEKTEATASWAYTLTTVRQANGSTANQIAVVCGVAEVEIGLHLNIAADNTNAGVGFSAGIGYDSTTSFNGVYGTGASQVANTELQISARLDHMPAVGYHFYSWNEVSVATGTTTWKGARASAPHRSSGLQGHWES